MSDDDSGSKNQAEAQAKQTPPAEQKTAAERREDERQRVEQERIEASPTAAAQRAAEETRATQEQSGRTTHAGESTNPDVQNLLVERSILEQNRAAVAPPVNKDALKEVDKQIEIVDKKLADLGFPQK